MQVTLDRHAIHHTAWCHLYSDTYVIVFPDMLFSIHISLGMCIRDIICMLPTISAFKCYAVCVLGPPCKPTVLWMLLHILTKLLKFIIITCKAVNAKPLALKSSFCTCSHLYICIYVDNVKSLIEIFAELIC